jgi:hypothetical protein
MNQMPTDLSEEIFSNFSETLKKLKDKCEEKTKSETGETPQKRRKTKERAFETEGNKNLVPNQDNSDSSDSESIADNGCERLLCTLSDLLQLFECK